MRQVNTHIVDEFNLWFPKDERQRVLWSSTVILDSRYYLSLIEHAVPLDRGTLGRLADSAIALDVYAWLAQRLYRIRHDKPAFLPWPAVKAQFGADYGRIRKFRERFLHTLGRVLSEYRTARVEADERGMTLRFSPPPIPARGGYRWQPASKSLRTSKLSTSDRGRKPIEKTDSFFTIVAVQQREQFSPSRGRIAGHATAPENCREY